MSTVSRRIDMVGFISAHNCNPNGDPNEGNRPLMTSLTPSLRHEMVISVNTKKIIGEKLA